MYKIASIRTTRENVRKTRKENFDYLHTYICMAEGEQTEKLDSLKDELKIRVFRTFTVRCLKIRRESENLIS